MNRDAGAVRLGGSMRLFGIIMLALAGFLAWHSNWFHAEKDLSHYPEIQLAYTTGEGRGVSPGVSPWVSPHFYTAGEDGRASW